MSPAEKLLIIHHDPDLLEQAHLSLSGLSYDVMTASSGKDGLQRIYHDHPDIIILSAHLTNDPDSRNICSQIMAFTSTPVIIISDQHKLTKTSEWFKAGVEDVISEPLDYDELEGRLYAIQKRAQENEVSDVRQGQFDYKDDHLRVDLQNRVIYIQDSPVQLTPKESGLLRALVDQPGHVFTAEELLDKVWPEKIALQNSLIPLYIHYLRKKMDLDEIDHQYIRTEWGEGYWFSTRKRPG